MSHVIVIAGPNGAGKSTVAPFLLRDKLGVSEFVNADTIAQGLSAYSPEKAAIPAGRIMLERINKLSEMRSDFAFESTLSTKTFLPKIIKMRENGYRFKLLYLWLASDELAVLRVAERVRQGGHNVPTMTIKRRYRRGLSNFFNLYQKIADSWFFYENSDMSTLKLVAKGRTRETVEVRDDKLWNRLRGKYER